MAHHSRDAETINKKLQQQEEWLKQFKSNVRRSGQIRESIETIIDKFHKRLVSLEENVLPMHETNGRLQVKQHNIQRLINTIDATIQFYGKTNELENSIRDGAPSLNMNAYLENMESLQQAIQFFESHPNYQKQSENMKTTLETGFSQLEKEYRSLLQRNTMPAAPAVLKDCLDDHYELISTRAKEIKTLTNLDEIVKLGLWLLKRGRLRFLNSYSEIRGENMMKTIMAVDQHYHIEASKPHSRTSVLKHAKKMSRAERIDKKDGTEMGGASENGALLILGSLLALLEIEEGIMQKTIPDTSNRAQVFREVISKPLSHVIRHVHRVVQDSDGGLIPLLPLLRFLSKNQTRLHNLAANAMGDVPFESLLRLIRVNASTHINEFVEGLRNDSDPKNTPKDGNVHSVTANTINFLVTLTKFRPTVNQLLQSMSANPGENIQLLLPKLFARILSALGICLKRKADTYDDGTVATIFLLNNNHHISKSLSDEEVLPDKNEHTTQILSFYESEISKCRQRYMHSWNSALHILRSADKIGHDPNTVRMTIANFTREFDQIHAGQRLYCISDENLASKVRDQVRDALVPGYSILYERQQGASGTKYTPELLSISINRLFDVAA